MIVVATRPVTWCGPAGPQRRRIYSCVRQRPACLRAPDLRATSVSCALADATNGQIIEGGNRVGLCPQTHSTGLESRVAVVEKQRTIEPTLDMVTDRDHPEQMPLTEGGRLDAGASELIAPAVVGVEPEVVLERVGSHHIVSMVAEAEHDAARSIFFPGQQIELHRDVEVR